MFKIIFLVTLSVALVLCFPSEDYFTDFSSETFYDSSEKVTYDSAEEVSTTEGSPPPIFYWEFNEDSGNWEASKNVGSQSNIFDFKKLENFQKIGERGEF